MRVSFDKCQTVDEELDHIEKQLDLICNFFVCDAPPNRIRAAKISADKLHKKIHKIKNSPAYKDFYE